MPLVTTKIDDGVAVITINSPPMNMGTVSLRRALMDELSVLPRGLRGVVLISGLADFYAGSDIREFDGPIAEPQLPALIAMIEDLPPVVAALSGFTLGGGLELALGCDVRIASRQTTVGLPETTLGIIPGAGGTVRLPRLIGVPAAIGLISTGRLLEAGEAHALGIIDAVVDEGELLAEAMKLARGQSVKRRLSAIEAPESLPAEVDSAVAKALKKGRARPNVAEAVELIVTGIHLPGPEALARERASFERLRSSDEAANLRYLFFATRAAAKAIRVGTPPPVLSTIGVAGAGTMGSRIASACLTAGLDVVVFDSNAGALSRAGDQLRSVARGATVELTGELAGLAHADLIIDAVFEDMTVKKQLFAAMGQVVGAETVLASNTSYLDLNEIARAVAHPERCVGLHFFNPADRNPLVELIRTATSGDRAFAAVAELARLLGKSPIPAGVAEGFVANRVYADYRTQVEFLLEDGAWPDQIDSAMQTFGFAVGPFAVADMSGLDIAWARRKRLAQRRDERQRYVTIPDQLCESGRLGRKSGAGYYTYGDAAGPVLDEQVRMIIRDAQHRRSSTSVVNIDDNEIVQRVIMAMVVAASEVVAKGTAQRASDVDVAMTAGFAFPKWRGGPIRYASGQPERWQIEGLARVYHSDPFTYASLEPATRGEIPGPVAGLLAAVRR